MRTLRLIALAALATLAVFVPTATADDDEGAAACGPNIVANGDFEVPPAGVGFTTYFAPSTIGGWLVESGSVDHIDGYWQAASGTQSLDLNGLAPGTISQQLTTTPDETYILRFAMAGNPDGPPTVKSMNVSFGGAVVTSPTFSTAGRSLAAMGWVYHEVVVQATAATTELEFDSTTEMSPFGPALDDVSVCQILDDDGDDDDGDDDGGDDDEDDG